MRGHKYDVDPVRDPETGRVNRAELWHRAKGWFAVLLSFAILFGGFGFGAYKAYDAYTQFKYAKDFPGPGQGEVQIVVPEKSTSSTVGKLLAQAGVVKDAKKFSDAAAQRPDLWGKVRAGKYRLEKGIPSADALKQLADPERAIRVMVTLRSGQTVPQLLQAISEKNKMDVTQLLNYARTTKPSEIGTPGYAPQSSNLASLEGFMFPDTYEMPEDGQAGTMVKKSVGEFNKVATELDLVRTAESLNFGSDARANSNKAYAVVTIASIIEREASRPEDQAKVARVIYNRLGKGMKLQLDSTTAYAVKKYNTIWTTDAERAYPSPYNTYVVAGLPPTPISNPGEGALNAALHPENGDWLYFQPVNLDTGETIFSADQATHDQAAGQLQAWCQQSDANKAKCA